MGWDAVPECQEDFVNITRIRLKLDSIKSFLVECERVSLRYIPGNLYNMTAEEFIPLFQSKFPNFEENCQNGTE